MISELREKVADAIADAWDKEGMILHAADAAIAVVLEEAARVADNYGECYSGREVAATIRGLISSSSSGS